MCRSWAEDTRVLCDDFRDHGVRDRILQMFKKESGVGSVSGAPMTYPDAQTKILSGGGDFDCSEIIGERLKAVIATNKVTPIAVSEIPNWSAIRDTVTKPDPK